MCYSQVDAVTKQAKDTQADLKQKLSGNSGSIYWGPWFAGTDGKNHVLGSSPGTSVSPLGTFALADVSRSGSVGSLKGDDVFTGFLGTNKDPTNTIPSNVGFTAFPQFTGKSPSSPVGTYGPSGVKIGK